MATLKDVAKNAGVSTATVSRVLNSSGVVHTRTRERVEAAIAALGYQPSRVARRLRVKDQGSYMLGLMIPDLQNPFFAEIARGVEDVAYEHRHALIVCNSDENPEKEEFYLQTMRAESVDGFIVPTTVKQSASFETLMKEKKPIVFVDRRAGTFVLDTVVVDNQHGAYLATERLLQLGHRRIGIIIGLPHLSTSQERLAGYKRALQEHGVPFDDALVRVGDSRRQGGYDETQALMALPGPPTALFPCNNMMTLGALQALHELGQTVGDGVALIGFDDLPSAMAFNPPLTVVQQPAYEMGRQAAILLLRRMRDPEAPHSQVVLTPKLILRGSHGSPR